MGSYPLRHGAQALSGARSSTLSDTRNPFYVTFYAFSFWGHFKKNAKNLSGLVVLYPSLFCTRDFLTFV